MYNKNFNIRDPSLSVYTRLSVYIPQLLAVLFLTHRGNNHSTFFLLKYKIRLLEATKRAEQTQLLQRRQV